MKTTALYWRITQCQTTNLEEKHQNCLNWILTGTLQLHFVPGLMSTILDYVKVKSYIIFHWSCISVPILIDRYQKFLSIVDSMPGSQPTGLGQVIGKSNTYLTLLCWCRSVKQLPHATDLAHRRGRAACPGGCQPRVGLPLAAVRSKPQTEAMRNWVKAHFSLLVRFQNPSLSPQVRWQVLRWLSDTFCTWTVLLHI